MGEKSRSYEIENCIVTEVKTVTKTTGIISDGYDREGVKIYINNLDAGNSIALYKAATQTRKKNSMGLGVVILGTITSIVFFIVVFIGYIRFTENPVEVPQIISENTNIQNSEPILLETGTGSENSIKNDIEEKQASIFEAQKLAMQNQFALESIKIELQKKDIKIQEIQNENSILLSRNEVLEEEKNILIVEVEKLNAILFEIEAKKNTRDGLFLQIGEYIDGVCRENNTNDCKDMYFNILK